MKIWVISDTHNKHGFLDVPSGIDMIIHAGDFSIRKELHINTDEALNFLHWYNSLNIRYKVLIAGNHDVSLERGSLGLNKLSSTFQNIIYLENNGVVIEDINIWGSPLTPTFGDRWAFNKSRETINRYWEHIPDNTNILITHGPPKGILDLNQNNIPCGCNALKKRVYRIQPKYHIFGHIHNEGNSINSGIFNPTGINTTFINASVTSVPKYDLLHNGVIIEI